MDITSTITIAIIIIIILVVVRKFVISYKMNKCIMLLQVGEYNNLECEMNSLFTKFFIPKYNLEYLRLSMAQINHDQQLIEKQFKLLINAKKTKAQDKDILMKAFNYYLDNNQRQNCLDILNEIKSNLSPKDIYEAQTMFDIYFDKSSKYLDEMLTKSKVSVGQEKGLLEYLIAVQYDNLGDIEMANKYKILAKQSMQVALNN